MKVSITPLLFVTMVTNLVAQQPRPVPKTATRLEPFGLDGMPVTALDISPSREYLYATTDGYGVFRRALFHPDSGWIGLGLEGKRLTALDIQVWGDYAPIVGVEPDYSQGDSTLIYRREDRGWMPADSGIARDFISSISGLASFTLNGNESPGKAFAVGFSSIYCSNNLGRWWKEVLKGGIGGQINVIAVNQNSGEVWFGGHFEFTPWIGKSTDQGNTWEHFRPPVTLLDYACHSLAFHPTNPDIVYAGMDGEVIKTTDGGKSWHLTGLRLINNPLPYHALAVDPFNFDHLYAGGIKYPNNWVLYESFDAGDTWLRVPGLWPNTAGITSIVADLRTPGMIYIATLGSGVWQYQSEGAGVGQERRESVPEVFVLHQNYPNPFNTQTVIEFSLPKSCYVNLNIFDSLGREVRTLVSRNLPPGNYGVSWDGRNEAGHSVPSGIYLCSMQAGQVRRTVKILCLK